MEQDAGVGAAEGAGRRGGAVREAGGGARLPLQCSQQRRDLLWCGSDTGAGGLLAGCNEAADDTFLIIMMAGPAPSPPPAAAAGGVRRNSYCLAAAACASRPGVSARAGRPRIL